MSKTTQSAAAGSTSWLPIATAPKDGTIVLVNDTTEGLCPFVAARYLDSPEWSGWIYDEEVLTDNNALGPNPTHWLPIPPVPAA